MALWEVWGAYEPLCSHLRGFNIFFKVKKKSTSGFRPKTGSGFLYVLHFQASGKTAGGVAGPDPPESQSEPQVG